MTQGSWGWEIQKIGGGPHHYLTLRFAATVAELEQTLEPLLSGQFEQWQSRYQWKSKGSGSGCYTLVELQGNSIEVTHGWGNIEAAEAALLQRLFATHALQHWQVVAGGEGYASQVICSGGDLASFVNYCHRGQASS